MATEKLFWSIVNPEEPFLAKAHFVKEQSMMPCKVSFRGGTTILEIIAENSLKPRNCFNLCVHSKYGKFKALGCEVISSHIGAIDVCELRPRIITQTLESEVSSKNELWCTTTTLSDFVDDITPEGFDFSSIKEEQIVQEVKYWPFYKGENMAIDLYRKYAGKKSWTTSSFNYRKQYGFKINYFKPDGVSLSAMLSTLDKLDLFFKILLGADFRLGNAYSTFPRPFRLYDNRLSNRDLPADRTSFHDIRLSAIKNKTSIWPKVDRWWERHPDLKELADTIYRANGLNLLSGFLLKMQLLKANENIYRQNNDSYTAVLKDVCKRNSIALSAESSLFFKGAERKLNASIAGSLDYFTNLRNHINHISERQNGTKPDIDRLSRDIWILNSILRWSLLNSFRVAID